MYVSLAWLLEKLNIFLSAFYSAGPDRERVALQEWGALVLSIIKSFDSVANIKSRVTAIMKTYTQQTRKPNTYTLTLTQLLTKRQHYIASFVWYLYLCILNWFERRTSLLSLKINYSNCINWVEEISVKGQWRQFLPKLINYCSRRWTFC